MENPTLTRHERIEIEHECMKIAKLIPEIRKAAFSIIDDLTQDPNPPRDVYWRRVRNLYGLMS